MYKKIAADFQNEIIDNTKKITLAELSQLIDDASLVKYIPQKSSMLFLEKILLSSTKKIEEFIFKINKVDINYYECADLSDLKNKLKDLLIQEEKYLNVFGTYNNEVSAVLYCDKKIIISNDQVIDCHALNNEEIAAKIVPLFEKHYGIFIMNKRILDEQEIIKPELDVYMTRINGRSKNQYVLRNFPITKEQLMELLEKFDIQYLSFNVENHFQGPTRNSVFRFNEIEK